MIAVLLLGLLALTANVQATCPAGCVCTVGDTCDSCLAGFGGSVAMGGAVTCTACTSGTWSDGGTEACGACPTGCLDCLATGECTNCTVNYEPDESDEEYEEEGFACVPCLSGEISNGYQSACFPAPTAAPCMLEDAVANPCPNGLGGPNCEVECPKGLFGEFCDLSFVCSASCLPGQCSDNCQCDLCASGFGGTTCQPCTPGFGGNNCTYEFTCGAQCSSPCTADFQCGSCNDGYAGKNCERKCSPAFHGVDCKDAYICDANCQVGGCSSSGCLRCKFGFGGSNCDPCPTGTGGFNCTEIFTCGTECSSPCVAENRCTSCNDGYQGANCQTPCRPGKHGPTCQTDYICDANCVNNACLGDNQCSMCKVNYQTNATTGGCSACAIGTGGFQCTETFVCGTECAGPCIAQSSCGGVCNDGFTGENCQRACPFGYHGQYCLVAYPLGTVQGVVKLSNGQAAKKVEVALSGVSKTTRTSSFGRYKFLRVLAQDDAKLTITVSGEAPVESAAFDIDGDTNMDIQL